MNHENLDLSKDDDLKQACEAIRESRSEWKAKIVTFLRDVQNSDEETRNSLEFQRKLWNENPISQPARQGPKVDGAIEDEEFRRWFVQRLKEPEPSAENTEERLNALATLEQDVLDRITNSKYGIGEKPQFKTARALAALYPRDFTTMFTQKERRQIAAKLGISGSGTNFEEYKNILKRLEKVLGPAGNDLESVVERMCLPRILYQQFVAEKNSDAPNPAEETGQAEPADVTRAPLADVQTAIRERGHFPAELVAQLDAGLWANERRHFAVLTGLSGAGKTLLARTYGRAIAGGDERHVCVVPVQPAWYDPSPLLGYVNPLKPDRYEKTEFLLFLMQADDNHAKPHTAVLDEMNLSRPEQYMAPLLSAMETGGDIPLHGEGKTIDGVPERLRYPPNLVLIGTVNMDETTHALSDKVLDRAFTLEFWDIDLDDYPGWGKRNLGDAEAEARKVLAELMGALRPERLHFGWRTVDDVLDFLAVALNESHGVEVAAALDSVIYAKVLPKLRGDDRPELRAALDNCKQALSNHGLTRCYKRVEELTEDLNATGSVRFWR